MKGYRLPPGLMLGAATASAQIEGGFVPHSWREWERRGKLHPEASAVSITEASGHWKNWKEDIDIASGLGIETYRFSIEWARIQPQKDRVDMSAVNRYREEISYMIERGIRPLLTLHHFSNPMWFEKLGAFSKPSNVRYFLKYVGIAVNYFGDLVSDYVTINEPNVYSLMGYGGGGFPPGETNFVKARRVLSVMAGCHIRAYEKIHRMRGAMGYDDTKVGCAIHMRAFGVMDPVNPVEARMKTLERFMFQGAAARAFLTGEFSFPLENLGKFRRGVYCDYLGINYYTRSHLRKLGDDLTRPQDPKSDYGWEIYPQGLEECMRELYGIVRKPVWILENGVCDTDDSFRSLYIYDHLAVVARTKIPVERYYYWSLIDNFEWLDGMSRRFGLVSVDSGTMRRKVKKSGHFYREIIRMGGVTEALADQYTADEKYHL